MTGSQKVLKERPSDLMKGVVRDGDPIVPVREIDKLPLGDNQVAA
jgi:hypothetical protein